MTKVVTRSQAKALGMTHHFTGKPCKYGHVSERLVSNRTCCECMRESARKWREANPEKYRESCRKADLKWCAANQEKKNALLAKRKASKRNATPKWLTAEHLSDIEDLYMIARMFKTYTGLDYHVDHIVPLRGKTVSGLHVPWNLTVLESTENTSKGNRHWPDMP